MNAGKYATKGQLVDIVADMAQKTKAAIQSSSSGGYITQESLNATLAGFYDKSATNALLGNKADGPLVFDSVPTDGSDNLVTSDGVYKYINDVVGESLAESY